MKTNSERIEKKDFYGNYRGEVVDNNDPLKAGRCKIRVFSVYDDLSDEEIPWAVFADPFMGGLEDTGGSFLPSVGAHVWAFFEEGDHRQPVFFAGAPAMNAGTTPDLPSESRDNGEYPLNRVFKTKAGHYIEFDSTEGEERIKIHHTKDHDFKMEKDEIIRIDHAVGHYLLMRNDQNNKDVKLEHTNGSYIEITDGDTIKIYNENGAFITIDGSTGNTKCDISATKTDIGDSDSSLQPIVLGDNLASWIMNTLKTYLDTHTHTGNLGAPTSPPITPFAVGNAVQGGSVYSDNNNSQ